MEALRLEIVTPDKVVLEANVDYVGAPGVDGEFGVLPGHIPLLAALSIGELYYKQGAETHWAFVAGGFAEVSDNKVSKLRKCLPTSTWTAPSRPWNGRRPGLKPSPARPMWT